MPAIIEAQDLRKNYGKTVAVSGIRFSVNKGEIFGFLGPNGAGKTTTMKMITCISPRSSGELAVFGMDPDKSPAEIKQRLGIVPQETNLDPDFSCFGNLFTYARYFDILPGAAEKKADELLEFVQLQEKRDVSVDKLSGGMKRRLILARALVNSPDLLILDEPTIGLDPQARHLIWDRLKQLKNAGKTLILTTHFMDEAERLCDDLIVIDHGRKIAEGSPRSLIAEHIEAQVVEVYDEAGGDLPAFVAAHGSLAERVESSGETAFFYCRNSQPLLQALQAATGLRYVHRASNLEDVFIKLTGRELRD